MEGTTGSRRQAEQRVISYGSPLPTQTAESPSAFLVSSSGQQTEEKIGCVRTVEQTMVFREFPAPMPITERLWVTVAPFSEQWGRSRRQHPPRLLHQLQRLLRHRGPDRLHRLTQPHRLTQLHRLTRPHLGTRGDLRQETGVGKL